MRSRSQDLLIAAAVAAVTLGGAPARSREVYDDVFFVKPQGSAASLFQDRGECRRESQGLGGTAASYTNPEYGALNAMGSALDEDALHEGGLHKRLARAVFDDCMKRRGWTPMAVTSSQAHLLMRADARHPEALEAWLKAYQPPPEPAAQPEKTATAIGSNVGATPVKAAN